ncbi:MAG: hypothetical protein WKG03_16705 [Telluria sp.]
MKTLQPEDYKHIAVWGRQLGSFHYYIKAQQERACAAGAPINAIYEKYDSRGATGVWVTVDEYTPAVRDRVNTALPGAYKCFG